MKNLKKILAQVLATQSMSEGAIILAIKNPSGADPITQVIIEAIDTSQDGYIACGNLDHAIAQLRKAQEALYQIQANSDR